MFFQKIIKIINIIFLSNLDFFPPKKNKILIFDRNGSKIIFNYIDKKNCSIMSTRYENFNLYVIFLMIVKFQKLNMLSYFDTYIKFCQPSYIFTYTDNNFNFYRLKKLNYKIRFIAIQNGIRDFQLEGYNEILSEKLFIDDFFVFSKNSGKEINKYIKAKFYPIGSLKNNFFYKNKSKKKNKVFFISQFFNKSFDLKKKSFQNFYKCEHKLLTYLNDYFKDTKYELIILARNFSNNKKNELIFYRNIFKSNRFNIEFKNNENESYKYFNGKNFFIFIRSTLGFEAWSRNERAISFAERKIDKLDEFYIDPFRKLKKKGFFYTNNMNQNEFKRLMNNLFSKNQIMIKKETDKLKNYFLKYDYNNKIFRKYLKKYKI